MHKYLLILTTLIFGTVKAQSIHYDLRMSHPQNHYFEVEMTLEGFKEKELDVHMPVWAPGSYLVREFAKNVNLVKAYDGDGNMLEVHKNAKNSWHIRTDKAKKVRVKYEVYSFELSVRTSFLDLTHGFVSGTSVFMFVDGYINKPGTLTIYPYHEFKKITTALPTDTEGESSDNAHYFSFANYDQLVDCPIEIGNQEVFEFEAAGVKHTVGIYGWGNYDVPTLQKDMKRIVEEETKVFGQNPNKEYTFIIHNVVDAQGGLEHVNSTTLSVNRWTYQGGEYAGFLSLVAHEYFHLWNVKRIRPVQLGPFNYDAENYTSLLWVMEGFTSYYDELIPLRAGFYTSEQFLGKLQGTLNYVETSEGSRVQPVAHASYDAWIKAYRPNENSANTTMTYYSRGSLLAALIDAMIIQKTDGQKCLDHFMRKLYEDFYVKKQRGFSEEEFQEGLESFLGEDLDSFFNDYVYGTKIPDYNKYLSPLGVSVSTSESSSRSLGVSLRQDGGKLIVRSVRSGSPAEKAGISVNDEIVGIDGFRVDYDYLERLISGSSDGQKFQFLVAREDLLYPIEVTMENYVRTSFELAIIPGENKLRDYWLR